MFLKRPIQFDFFADLGESISHYCPRLYTRISGPIVIMKIQDYKTILSAVERALEVCDQSSGFMDEMHREICENLRETRIILVRLIGSMGPESV